jgi:tetratricopeptide (TPR) repeat protein
LATCARPSPSPGLRGIAPRRRAREAGLAAALLLLTAAAFAPAVRNGFVWDDDAYVHQNPTLESAAGLRRIWLEPGATPQYYPLVHTSFWLERRVFGRGPAGYHAVNVLLHATAALLLWRVLRLLEAPGAFLAAALFAVHPVQVESVAWISERKNVLSGALYFGAALAWLHRVGGGGGARQRLAFALYASALLAKTVTCTLPAALLLVRWWRREPVLERALLRRLAPFFATGLALGLLTVQLEKTRVGAEGPPWDLSPAERVLVAGRALFFYAGKLAWPADLCFVYPRFALDARDPAQWLYPGAALAVGAALFAARRRLGRGPLAAALYFGGTLFPALGFFDVFPMRYSFVADHFQYLACAGPFALAAALASRLPGPRARRAARGALVLAVALCAAQSFRLVPVYADLETLWRHTVAVNPEAWMAHFNLGNELRRQGRREEAAAAYREALRARPDLATAHHNLAGVLAQQGDLDGAVSHYRRVLELEPWHAAARSNLGAVLASRGRLEEALAELREALRLRPGDPRVRQQLAAVLERLGRTEEARRAAGEAPR